MFLSIPFLIKKKYVPLIRTSAIANTFQCPILFVINRVYCTVFIYHMYSLTAAIFWRPVYMTSSRIIKNMYTLKR